MAAQYDVNLEKCALLKCLCGSAFAAGQAPVRSLALKISVIFGHTDKSSLITVTSFESVKTLRLFVCTQNNNETLCF